MSHRIKQARLPHHSADDSLINLTPLIDVVFVVLIMFIIIAPLLEVDHIKLAPGKTNTTADASASENSPIVIHVTEDNQIKLNHQYITEKQLTPALIALKKSNPSHLPQLFHDKKAYFGTYQTVKNAAETAGFEQIDVLLSPGS